VLILIYTTVVAQMDDTIILFLSMMNSSR